MNMNVKTPQIYLVPIVVLITAYYYINNAPAYLIATLVIIVVLSATISIENVNTDYVYEIVAILGVVGMLFGYLRYNSIITVSANLLVVVFAVGRYIIKKRV